MSEDEGELADWCGRLPNSFKERILSLRNAVHIWTHSFSHHDKNILPLLRCGRLFAERMLVCGSLRSGVDKGCFLVMARLCQRGSGYRH